MSKMMIQKNIYKSIFLLIMFMGTGIGFNTLSAQEKISEKEKNEGISGQFDVISNIKPKISDATKIDVIPEKEPVPQLTRNSFNYFFNTYPFQVRSSKPKLKQFQLDGEKLEALQQGYLYLAAGNYSNIEAEAFFNTVRNKTLILSGGGTFQHGNVSPIKPTNFNDLNIFFGGKKIMSKNNSATGAINFAHNDFYKYGQINANDTPFSPNDSLKQSFNLIDVSTSFLHQTTDTGKMNYNVGLEFYNFSDKYKFSENRLFVKGNLIEPYKENKLIFDASFEFLSYGKDKTVSRSILRIDAKYKFKLNGLTAELGFKTANENDTQSFFRFYPHIKGDLVLVENRLSGFLNLSGGLETVTFRGLATQNQFIASQQSIANRNNKLISEIGLMGRADNKFWYSASLGYNIVSNFYTFINQLNEVQSFSTIYNTKSNTGIFNIKAETGYIISEKIQTNFLFKFNSYSFDDKARFTVPFLLPKYEYTLNFKYDIDKQISVFSNLQGFSSRNAFVLGLPDNSKKLSAINDINIGAVYNFNKKFGVDLQFKNILNKQYQLFNYYPVRGFQILFGAKIKFL